MTLSLGMSRFIYNFESKKKDAEAAQLMKVVLLLQRRSAVFKLFTLTWSPSRRHRCRCPPRLCRRFSFSCR
jgi:hypothetical protein